MRKHKRKNVVYVGFMNLEKAYDRVNRKALWQVLRMYDMGDELLNGIKSMYVISLACVRVSVLGSTVVQDRDVSCPLGSSMYI